MCLRSIYEYRMRISRLGPLIEGGTQRVNLCPRLPPTPALHFHKSLSPPTTTCTIYNE